MKGYQARGLRAVLASRAVMAVLFLALMGVGFAAFRAVMQMNGARAERQHTEERVRELERTQAQLKEEVQDFTTGYGVEREARDKLNLRKPGEEVVIILDNTKGGATATTSGGHGTVWRLFKRLEAFIGFGTNTP